MKVEITHIGNANNEGVILYLNTPAKLKSGNVKGKVVWVSWDKIGKALIENYK